MLKLFKSFFTGPSKPNVNTQKPRRVLRQQNYTGDKTQLNVVRRTSLPPAYLDPKNMFK